MSQRTSFVSSVSSCSNQNCWTTGCCKWRRFFEIVSYHHLSPKLVSKPCCASDGCDVKYYHQLIGWPTFSQVSPQLECNDWKYWLKSSGPGNAKDKYCEIILWKQYNWKIAASSEDREMSKCLPWYSKLLSSSFTIDGSQEESALCADSHRSSWLSIVQ
jgi:hypothetical protein